jgi:ribosome-associated protein
MKAKTPKTAFPPILQLVCRALDDKKAENIRVLRVKEQSSITDFLVLATGTSQPHLRALRVELEKVIDAAQVRIVGIDTGVESGWFVIDAFDIMVHLFTAENRDKYSLENLWKDAEEISMPALAGEPAKRPKRSSAGAKKTKTRRKPSA